MSFRPPAARTSETHERCGPYLLESRIAVGGMGEVFRGRRIGPASFARVVCIKRMHAHLSLEPELVQRFVEEARLGARLRHRNLVAVEDLGVHEGRHFLAMEYVHGVDLLSMRRRAHSLGLRVPPEVGMYVAFEALSALHALHTARDPDTRKPLGVVHRDVTPHNLLVSFAGQVKLTDYGVARSSARRIDTLGRTPCGKPSYMPIEQATGTGVSPRSDLFALGVTLFELFTGAKPYATNKLRPTLMEVVAAQLRNERVSLGLLRPDLPAGFVAAVDAMLEPSAGARIASADIARAQIAPHIAVDDGARTMTRWLSLLWPDEPSLQLRPGPGEEATDTVPDALVQGPGTVPVPPRANIITSRTRDEPDDRTRALPGSRMRIWGLALLLATFATPTQAPTRESATQHSLRPFVPPFRARWPLAWTGHVAAFHETRERECARAGQETGPRRQKPPSQRHAPNHRDESRGHASLRVVALPWGEILVDGRDLGGSPVTAALSSGAHHLVIDGPHRLERTVHLDDGQLRVIVVEMN